MHTNVFYFFYFLVTLMLMYNNCNLCNILCSGHTCVTNSSATTIDLVLSSSPKLNKVFKLFLQLVHLTTMASSLPYSCKPIKQSHRPQGGFGDMTMIPIISKVLERHIIETFYISLMNNGDSRQVDPLQGNPLCSTYT